MRSHNIKKKYLLNCSVVVNRRIMKLTYRESRFLEMFCCNGQYKTQTADCRLQTADRVQNADQV